MRVVVVEPQQLDQVRHSRREETSENLEKTVILLYQDFHPVVPRGGSEKLYKIAHIPKGVPMSEKSEAKQFFSTYQPKSHLQIGPTEKFSNAGLEGDIRP